MKHTIIAAILSITFYGTTLANTGATNGPANPHATSVPTIPHFKGMEHFLEKFPTAADVNCRLRGQVTEVNFIWNGIKLQAFYDAAGDPVAISRFITVDNLPVSAQMSLKKDYAGYVATEAAEFDGAEDGLCYYVTVVSPKNSYLLHVSTSGTISVFKKMKQ